jgi:hypothetical protein
MIGIADSRSSSSFTPGLAELVFALAVGSPPVLLGTVAFFRLPAGDSRRAEALAAVLLGVGVAFFLLFLIFV